MHEEFGGEKKSKYLDFAKLPLKDQRRVLPAPILEEERGPERHPTTVQQQPLGRNAVPIGLQ